jgi:hypothetical protein
MCGRVTATFEFSDIRIRWNLDRDLPHYTHCFNIAPETSPNFPPSLCATRAVMSARSAAQCGVKPHCMSQAQEMGRDLLDSAEIVSFVGQKQF